MRVEDMPPQTREKYCEEHELFHTKNSMGLFVCPFCESNVDL